MARILNGATVAAAIEKELSQILSTMLAKPVLTVIKVGHHGASDLYVRMKERACNRVGIKSQVIKMDEKVGLQEILAVIHCLNNNEEIDGILVQLPLPSQIDVAEISEAILPVKDVDCFHSYNIGRLFMGKTGHQPCTPLGCMVLLKRSGITIEGKKAVVVGRSNIVGKPMALMLLQENATVSICHSQTINLRQELKPADIVVVAIGRPRFIKGVDLKEGSVVVDVGQHRLEGGSVVGDVDYDSAAEVVDWITPVPGGTGPMTVAMLLHNTIQAFAQRRGIAINYRLGKPV